ncbi:MAG: anti-phage dCTP deaminase [Myxococcaceae bacterium]
MSSTSLATGPSTQAEPTVPGRQILSAAAANEVVFAVVGHVGSGTSVVARMLEKLLSQAEYQVEVIKAREVIEKWAATKGLEPKVKQPTIDSTTMLQDLGDRMRAELGDNAAVARGVVSRVRVARAKATGKVATPGAAVEPDGKKRAFVVDALRHPEEALFLRSLYDSAFTLIGVVCDEAERLRRLQKKFDDGGETKTLTFMQRDAKDALKNGQRVSDTFHLSDFFVNNTERQALDDKPNEDWPVPDELTRLVRLVVHKDIVRPSVEEVAMFAAHGAQMRSACLSRQVGASLVDSAGNLVATGTNEVPRAGGGAYSNEHTIDERCAFRSKSEMRFCSNTREQSEIVEDIIKSLAKVISIPAEKRGEVERVIRESRIGGLLEFSRAIHAEMDALLSAARTGKALIGARLFVTTYPCHYCARHLVAAGVDEVLFIEPYPKSRALSLHADSITHSRANWTPPSSGGNRVLFRAFSGVAPRMYARAFLKERDLKDASGKMAFGSSESSNRWNLGKKSYTELEASVEIQHA